MSEQDQNTDPDMSGFGLFVYMLKDLLIKSMIILPFVGLLVLIVIFIYGCNELNKLNGMHP